jgi:hypothetical protein
MATTSTEFIPELWSDKLVETMKQTITMNMIPQRSYGARLLRAAARGEDWTKIKREERHDPYTYTEHAADALAYAVDNDVLNSLLNRK